MFTSDPSASDSLRLTMTASTRRPEDGSSQSTEADHPEAGPAEAAEVTLTEAANLLVSVGDRCSNCGAALAIDQRYCVECGTRRGKPRFVIASAAGQRAGAVAPSARAGGGWSRLTATLAVIALLLAIGVGVLIGSAARGSIKQPVKVELTGGSLSSVAPTSGAGGSGANGATGSGAGGSTGKATAHGGAGGASPSCARGTAGCKNGRQTGNFFGG